MCRIEILLIIFQAACIKNIQSNCSTILNNGQNQNADSDFLEGQVISCLQQIFLKNEKDLFPECKRKIENTYCGLILFHITINDLSILFKIQFLFNYALQLFDV